LLVGLKSVDDFLELLDRFWTHDVDRRVVDRDPPIGVTRSVSCLRHMAFHAKLVLKVDQ
jgi:hypothetical protein